MSDECDFFERRGIKVTEEGAWRGIHDPHMVNSLRGFTVEKLANAPYPEYPARWLVCDCGERILTNNWRTE